MSHGKSLNNRGWSIPCHFPQNVRHFYDSQVCQVCTLCVNFLTEVWVILHALCVTQVTEGCVKKRVLQG